MTRAGTFVLVTIAAILASGCTSSDPRRQVAEQFIDRLFVTIDQAAARELTVGLAAAKIDEEIRLKAGQAIDESTRQPSVHYSFIQYGDDGQGATSSVVYELHVSPDGADAFTRRLILTLRREGETWRVANYTLE